MIFPGLNDREIPCTQMHWGTLFVLVIFSWLLEQQIGTKAKGEPGSNTLVHTCTRQLYGIRAHSSWAALLQLRRTALPPHWALCTQLGSSHKCTSTYSRPGSQVSLGTSHSLPQPSQVTLTESEHPQIICQVWGQEEEQQPLAVQGDTRLMGSWWITGYEAFS